MIDLNLSGQNGGKGGKGGIGGKGIRGCNGDDAKAALSCDGNHNLSGAGNGFSGAPGGDGGDGGIGGNGGKPILARVWREHVTNMPKSALIANGGEGGFGGPIGAMGESGEAGKGGKAEKKSKRCTIPVFSGLKLKQLIQNYRDYLAKGKKPTVAETVIEGVFEKNPVQNPLIENKPGIVDSVLNESSPKDEGLSAPIIETIEGVVEEHKAVSYTHLTLPTKA